MNMNSQLLRNFLLFICIFAFAKADQDTDKVDSLPVPQPCKDIMKQAIPEAKKAYNWIRTFVCEKAKCKPVFKELYQKYNVPMFKEKVVKEWIVEFFKKHGKPMPIDVMGKYDGIAKKCFQDDKKIFNIKNVCESKKEDFANIKTCIVGQVMGYLPAAMGWAEGGCKVAKDNNMVEIIVKPEVQPNWRKMVEEFPNDQLCHK